MLTCDRYLDIISYWWGQNACQCKGVKCTQDLQSERDCDQISVGGNAVCAVWPHSQEKRLLNKLKGHLLPPLPTISSKAGKKIKISLPSETKRHRAHCFLFLWPEVV